jgi:AraC-like DNA-binding protein
LNELAAPLRIEAEDLIITAPLVEHTFQLEPHDLEMKWLGFQTGNQVVRARVSMFPRALVRSGFRSADRFGIRYVGKCNEPLMDRLVKGISVADHLVMHRMPEAGEIIRRIQCEIRDNLSLAESFVSIKVLELFALVTRRLMQPTQSFEEAVMDRVEAYLRLNYAKPVSLGQLAKMSGYHPAYLCRKFKETKGLPPKAYLNKHRIRVSKEMLLAGKGVAETASLCGFGDGSHFSDFFKRKTGLSPSSYASTALSGGPGLSRPPS